jgi:hypothetical protein
MNEVSRHLNKTIRHQHTTAVATHFEKAITIRSAAEGSTLSCGSMKHIQPLLTAVVIGSSSAMVFAFAHRMFPIWQIFKRRDVSLQWQCRHKN